MRSVIQWVTKRFAPIVELLRRLSIVEVGPIAEVEMRSFH